MLHSALHVLWALTLFRRLETNYATLSACKSHIFTYLFKTVCSLYQRNSPKLSKTGGTAKRKDRKKVENADILKCGPQFRN